MMRLHRPAAVLFFLTILSFSVTTARADHLILAADDWCPINCEPGSDAPGIMVEIARQVFSDAGHSVEYRIIPWARAIREARQGNITGIIGAFTGDAPDFIFPDTEVMSVSGSAFFVLEDSTWVYTGVDSLTDVTLGAILQYDYGEAVNSYIEAHGDDRRIQMLSGKHPLERNIRKLLMGRVDVVIEAAPVFWHTATKMGVRNRLRFAGQASTPENCFIAFSPALEKSKEYAEILSSGIEALRQSGALQEIFRKYGAAP